MPRVSRAETEKNRIAIQAAASRLIRERGLGVSVADLMGAAGLTHGGFYGHFASKDALNAIACASALTESNERWRARTADAATPEQARAALVKGYLTPENRAMPANSCPLSSLSVDVSREPADKPIRPVFQGGLESLLGQLTDCQPPALTPAQRRARALAELSTLVGAMVLARAVSGSPLSDEVLEAARQALLPAPR